MIGLLCGLSGKHLAQWGLWLLREPRYLPVPWRVAFGSAFIGAYSHVLIDSVMHADVLPLYPFSPASPLHAIISIDALHVVCLATASVGGLVLCVLERANRTQKSDCD